MNKIIVTLVLTLVLGGVSRRYPIGWYPYDKSLGDALYAVATYLGLAVLLARRSPLVVGLLALAFCLAIETFKLTGIPAQYGKTPLRWVLGTTFSWHNLGCYVLGVGIIGAIDRMVLRPNARVSPRAAGERGRHG
jgi:hypothetical protein